MHALFKRIRTGGNCQTPPKCTSDWSQQSSSGLFLAFLSIWGKPWNQFGQRLWQEDLKMNSYTKNHHRPSIFLRNYYLENPKTSQFIIHGRFQSSVCWAYSGLHSTPRKLSFWLPVARVKILRRIQEKCFAPVSLLSVANILIRAGLSEKSPQAQSMKTAYGFDEWLMRSESMPVSPAKSQGNHHSADFL